jgi:hypothetical protein
MLCFKLEITQGVHFYFLRNFLIIEYPYSKIAVKFGLFKFPDAEFRSDSSVNRSSLTSL